jgi:hypothetical protein
MPQVCAERIFQCVERCFYSKPTKMGIKSLSTGKAADANELKSRMLTDADGC